MHILHRLVAKLEPRIAKMLGKHSGKRRPATNDHSGATTSIRDVISSRRNNTQHRQRSSQPNSSQHGPNDDDFEVVIYTKPPPSSSAVVSSPKLFKTPQESFSAAATEGEAEAHHREEEHSREMLRDYLNDQPDVSFINVTTPGFGGKENMHLSFDCENVSSPWHWLLVKILRATGHLERPPE